MKNLQQPAFTVWLCISTDRLVFCRDRKISARIEELVIEHGLPLHMLSLNASSSGRFAKTMLGEDIPSKVGIAVLRSQQDLEMFEASYGETNATVQ